MYIMRSITAAHIAVNKLKIKGVANRLIRYAHTRDFGYAFTRSISSAKSSSPSGGNASQFHVAESPL